MRKTPDVSQISALVGVAIQIFHSIRRTGLHRAGANTDAMAQSAISPPGRLLASNCFQCHGTTVAAPGFDKLTGKSASKLYKKLKEFQSGGEGENIMARHAMGLTDAQLRELAQWLSTQK